MSTASDKRICVICAWRENCTKRYRVKTNALFDVNCPDYTRDIKLKDRDVDKLVEDQVSRWQKEKKGKAGARHYSVFRSGRKRRLGRPDSGDRTADEYRRQRTDSQSC